MMPALKADQLAALIRSLARDEGAGFCVSWPTLLDALTAKDPLPDGPEGWRAQLALKQAVRETTKAIPGMRFIEGDS